MEKRSDFLRNMAGITAGMMLPVGWGFTGHQSPYAHLRMMERLNEFSGFPTLQLPLSIVDFASEHSFVCKTLPIALENNFGHPGHEDTCCRTGLQTNYNM